MTISVFSRDAGTSTLGWRACSPFRMRVSMSAIGSVVVIPCLSPTPLLHYFNPPLNPSEGPRPDPAHSPSNRSHHRQHVKGPEALPGGFDDAGDFAGQGQLPEADPAQFELAQVAPRASAPEAPVAMPARQLRRLGGLRQRQSFISCDLGGCSHLSS